MTAPETSENGLLDGRVRIRQPVNGYRAATDPVLMAAAVVAKAGERVLDLGCGVGSAALCLAARVPGVALSGVEIQPEYAALARANAALNQTSFDVHDGDVANMPAALRAQTFDAVMLNPPWYPPGETPSPDPARDRARRADVGMDVWIGAALARTRQGGQVVIIQRAERLADVLTALDGPAGAIEILPLSARGGRAAKRVIVRARKSSRAPLRLLAPLVLHAGAAHDRDGDDHSAAAAAILRNGAPISF